MVSEYHIRQYEEIYGSTREMIRFMAECLGPNSGSLDLLDVACGGGANIWHMSRNWPDWRFMGLDLSADRIAYAENQHARRGSTNATFHQGNLFQLQRVTAGHRFEVVTFYQTLLLFDCKSYPDVLAALLAVATDWVFISSLFTDHGMDVISDIRLHVPCNEYPEGKVRYTTLCAERFAATAHSLGVKKVVFKDYRIDMDLCGPSQGGLGTYTVKTQSGRRLQFSGAVYMPWKFVALQLA